MLDPDITYDIKVTLPQKYKWEGRHIKSELLRLMISEAVTAKKLEILEIGIAEALERPEEAVTILKNALEWKEKVQSSSKEK